MTHKKQDEELARQVTEIIYREEDVRGENASELLTLIHSYANEARVKELQFILGWYDEYGRPQFDERGIKQRIAELEGKE